MSEFKKMDPKAKKVWLKALRSGKYEQAALMLCHLDGESISYCCLGVLAEECIVADWVVTRKSANDPGYALEVRRGKTFARSNGMLPPAALKQVGLCKNAADTLASMNDNDGKSFKQIANWIEKNL